MSEEDLKESDIYAVMTYAECTRSEAVEFLKKHFEYGPYGTLQWTKEDENK